LTTELLDLSRFPDSARDALRAGIDRLERGRLVGDVEAMVGASKELVETAAKVVLDALGHPYGSNTDLPGLASQALDALKLHPRAYQGRPSIQRLGASLSQSLQAIAELRNTDGTGHGRAHRSNLDPSHAEFVCAAALAWSQWLLSAADRALAERTSLTTALSDIGGAQTFPTGRLAKYLADLSLTELGDDDQRKLGLAVARRWTVNETFMPLTDVIEPLVDGQVEYPPAFREGLVEGLLLDDNGYIRTSAEDVRRAIRLALGLPGNRVEGLFRDVARRFANAQPSQTFTGNIRNETLASLLSLAKEQALPGAREALQQMANHVEAMGQAEITVRIDVSVSGDNKGK